MWGSVLREEFNSVFEEIFASIKKILILAGGWVLGYDSMEFRHFPDIS